MLNLQIVHKTKFIWQAIHPIANLDQHYTDVIWDGVAKFNDKGKFHFVSGLQCQILEYAPAAITSTVTSGYNNMVSIRHAYSVLHMLMW